MMAGSFGGGRVTVFPYRDITGVEYNAGLVNGILEVLTPSYSGTANKDFWQGTGGGRNADNNDPYTLSNTLPLPKTLYQLALPHLNELRKRIADSKQTNVVVTAPTATANLSDELSRLATLPDQGILDEGEFRDAKRSLIASQK